MPSRRTESPRYQEGFTLIELLVVIVVLGILAAVAIPAYIGQQRSARDARVVSDVRNTISDVTQWVLNNDRTAVMNTTDYISAGGKVVRSATTVIDVTASGTGAFTVCAYAGDGSSYDSSTNAYLYTSDTRRATRSTAGCPGDGAASTSTGSAPSGVASTGSTSTGSTSTGSTSTGTTPTGPTSTASTPTFVVTPPASTPTPSASNTPAPAQWVDCATEGGTCSFTGTHNVRYGIGPSSYAFKMLTAGTSCTNDVFGDPAYGYAKQCSYLK